MRNICKEKYTRRPLVKGLCLLLISIFSAGATTHYVVPDNPTAASPYLTWSSAAATIQDAVDAADAGDLILVTNGVYQTGARAVYGMSNRVAVTKSVMVRSVNGPMVTQIVGRRVPGTTNGPSAVRCVYLTNGAALSGFTLTNGATQTSGVSFLNESGGGAWCEGTSAVISNCVFTGNSAHESGGGIYYGTLNNCTLTGNSAIFEGGGAYYSMLSNSTLTGNWAGYQGGGAFNCTLNSCVLTGNSTLGSGGGSYSGTLNNCTLTGNSASSGGGISYATLYNCLVYYNSAIDGENYNGGAFTNCCSTPIPPGKNNLSQEPQLASDSHLSAGSPCIGQGNVAYASGVDIDGELWANPPSIGCDEFLPGSVTGALTVVALATSTNVPTGTTVNVQAVMGGRLSASRWDFGDGNIVSNRPYASHSWAVAGDYVVELRAYNESYPAGVAGTVVVHVVQAEHYVAMNSVNPVPPYSTWATAATNIQDAVDATTLPGEVVVVSNGVYQAGGRSVYGMNNRLVVAKRITVRSVNGPAATQILGFQLPGLINGFSAMRCVYLTNGATLSGFTLTHGGTQTSGNSFTNQSGGGVWCESTNAVVSNCIIAGNGANYAGGGIYRGTVRNCRFTGNFANFGGGAADSILNNSTLVLCSAFVAGGGASGGVLNNCTVADNSGGNGGGVSYATLNNCIIYYNRSDDLYVVTANNCCSSPAALGTPLGGNKTNEPLFVDINRPSNLRLQTNSPCINAGNNSFGPGITDLDGRPRVFGGAVDMGAYEFQPGVNSAFMGWLENYGLPTDGSIDYADADLDSLNNWQEWRAGTDPTNAASVLQVLSVIATNNPSGMRVTWQSVTGVVYYVQRSTNLGAQFPFVTVGSNIAGQAGTTGFTDTNAVLSGQLFYRIGVQP